MDPFKTTLKTDCEEILARFQATACVRFEEFSAIWRETKFSCIFYGISEGHEARNFTRLALSVAYPYILPPFSFQIRVGGLYLLYGLFNTQPHNPKEKIWLALKDWEDLMHFRQDATNAQHYDVVYVLQQLLYEKAFVFTAMPKTLFFQVRRKLTERVQPPSFSFVDPPSRPQELINLDLIEELSNVHEHYEGVKKAVFEESAQANVNLIKQNLVPQLRGTVLTFYNWQQNKTNQNDGDAGEGSSSHIESSRRAQLLASIKSRSYGQVVEASRSRRHRQIEVASGDLASNSAQFTSNRRPPSLKERTKYSLMSHGNLQEELLGATQLWHLTRADTEKVEKKKKRRFNWKKANTELLCPDC